MTARLSRSGHRLARRRVPTVKTGTHKVTVPIPNHVHAGVARLTLVAHAAAGNAKTIRRSLDIPAR